MNLPIGTDKYTTKDLLECLDLLGAHLQRALRSPAHPSDVPVLLEVLAAHVGSIAEACTLLQQWLAEVTPGVELRGATSSSYEASHVVEESVQELKAAADLLSIAGTHSREVRWNLVRGPAADPR